MFALHYFFVTEKALKQFFHNVSINLKPGGYFVGTVPDGKRINQCIKDKKVFQSAMLRIEARWQGPPAVFGSPYVCAIGDTVTGDEQGTEGSLEYLVYENVLVAIAAKFGLNPVYSYDDIELESCFDSGEEKKVLKHFKPYFPSSDWSLETASSLFSAFVFQKESRESGDAKVKSEEESKKREREHDDDDQEKTTTEQNKNQANEGQQKKAKT